MDTMKVLILSVTVLVPILCHNCYDQRCYSRASEDSSPEDLYIECNQTTNYCATNSTGHPLCVAGSPGNGTSCQEAVCVSYQGKAECIPGVSRRETSMALIWVPLAGVITALVVFVLVSLYRRELRRDPEIDEDLSPIVDEDPSLVDEDIQGGNSFTDIEVMPFDEDSI